LEELSEAIGDNSDGASILDKLKELDVVYVAYHPGAGHITMTSAEIRDYVENPNAFVAAKCFVTEQQYLKWLAHFESPVCQYELPKGQLCGQNVAKVSTPSDFDMGVSDACEIHKNHDCV